MDSDVRVRPSHAESFVSQGREASGSRVIDMFHTCSYAVSMSRMIQVRNVPEQLHATLKARAALSGQSLSDYLLAELRRVAERPSLEEMRSRLASRRPVRPRVSPARAVREERSRR